jgi:hypothetical protein
LRRQQVPTLQNPHIVLFPWFSLLDLLAPAPIAGDQEDDPEHLCTHAHTLERKQHIWFLFFWCRRTTSFSDIY